MADSEKKEKHKLIKALIQTKAEIDKAERERTAADKRTHQIKNSRTYKSAGPLKKMGKKNAVENENRRLEEELKSTRKELPLTKETLQLAKLDSTSMNSIKIQKSEREMKNDANLIDYIEKAVRQKNRHDENYNQALTYAGRL